jgi:hypothetical protein
VAESGFGTGLNFLTLWQAFADFRDTHLKLPWKDYISSALKNPLTREDLTLAHQHWPELAPWATALQEQWPLPLAGCHRLLLDEGRITLDLWFGDINELTSKLDDSLNQKVDAWFLDGFAPAKIRICGRQRCLTQWPVWLVPAVAGDLHLSRLCASGIAGSRIYDAKMQRLWSQTRNALWRNG